MLACGGWALAYICAQGRVCYWENECSIYPSQIVHAVVDVPMWYCSHCVPTLIDRVTWCAVHLRALYRVCVCLCVCVCVFVCVRCCAQISKSCTSEKIGGFRLKKEVSLPVWWASPTQSWHYLFILTCVPYLLAASSFWEYSCGVAADSPGDCDWNSSWGDRGVCVCVCSLIWYDIVDYDRSIGDSLLELPWDSSREFWRTMCVAWNGWCFPMEMMWMGK